MLEIQARFGAELESLENRPVPAHEEEFVGTTLGKTSLADRNEISADEGKVVCG
jgi:hypothetical protein